MQDEPQISVDKKDGPEKFLQKAGCYRKGPYSDYNPIFWWLKKSRRNFHYQPVHRGFDGPTQNSEYFWYPDLEEAALALGWKPRGKQKEHVPWDRKDLPSTTQVVAAQVTPPWPPKKRKH